MSALIDLTGQKFGKLTVVERFGNSYVKHSGKIASALWKCVCDCGEIRYKTTSDLRANRFRSCGCYAKEARSERLRLPDGEAARNYILYSYKNAARKRGYEWSISDELFDELIKNDCYYCGSKPIGIARIQQRSKVHTRELKELLYNGIDRFDNTKGYTPENVVTACKFCNRCKHILSGEDFIKLAKTIAARF